MPTLSSVYCMPRKFSMKRRSNETTTTSLKRLDKVKNHRQIGPLSPVSGIEMWEDSGEDIYPGMRRIVKRPSGIFLWHPSQISLDFLNSQEIDKIRWNMRNSFERRKLLTGNQSKSFLLIFWGFISQFFNSCSRVWPPKILTNETAN